MFFSLLQRVSSRAAQQLIRIYVAFIRGAFKFYGPCRALPQWQGVVEGGGGGMGLVGCAICVVG